MLDTINDELEFLRKNLQDLKGLCKWSILAGYHKPNNFSNVLQTNDNLSNK